MAERACVAEGLGELHGWIRGCMHGWRQCACLPPSTPVRFASGSYVSYWNAVLFIKFSLIHFTTFSR